MIYLLQHLLVYSACKYPEKRAVVFKEESITYKELDEVTDKLAIIMAENGVKRGDRVAIYMNKSIPSVISVLSILKAGAVYIPLDPNAPISRLSYIIKNADVKCLLTSTKKVKKVKEIFYKKPPLNCVIIMDDLLEIKTELPAKIVSWVDVVGKTVVSPPENMSIETDLAYILYTSGSTGVPKGVMISHLNALTFVNWCYDEFGIRNNDIISNHAPLHFDLSIFDIFTSIKAGATICLVPEEYSVFPRRLISFIMDNKITVWYSVPSILIHMMVHAGMKEYSFPHLRTILFAGEVFPIKYLRELIRIIPEADYFNLYGPTETNVCTYYHVKEIAPDRAKPIPIGKACRNIEVFALDENKERIYEYDREGELYVRGSCVARGYWGDPEKTKSSFIKNFLAREFDEIMYRTGDLVTIDKEGNYHLVGRIDHMIKSRGYRIELGEIEAVLYSHDNIKEAAVVAVPDELITNKIKSFIVPLNSDSLTEIEIEKYLSSRLPHYMIPEDIEFRDSLPKTSTGKIDRTLLSNS